MRRNFLTTKSLLSVQSVSGRGTAGFSISITRPAEAATQVEDSEVFGLPAPVTKQSVRLDLERKELLVYFVLDNIFKVELT